MTERRDDEPATAPLVVGYVAGAHGVHGVVRIHLHDADSEALAPGRTLELRRDDAPAGRHDVESVAPMPGKPNRRRVVLTDVADRDQAEALRGCEVLIERDQLPPLEDDEFYLADAIGLPVLRQHEGELQSLGTIVGLTSNGVQDLFEVEWRNAKGRTKTWLLPVIPQILVELDDQRVLVDVPLGLLPDELEDSG